MLTPVINYQRRILRDRLRPADARLAYGARVKGQQDMKEPLAAPFVIYYPSTAVLRQKVQDFFIRIRINSSLFVERKRTTVAST